MARFWVADNFGLAPRISRCFEGLGFFKKCWTAHLERPIVRAISLWLLMSWCMASIMPFSTSLRRGFGALVDAELKTNPLLGIRSLSSYQLQRVRAHF